MSMHFYDPTLKHSVLHLGFSFLSDLVQDWLGVCSTARPGHGQFHSLQERFRSLKSLLHLAFYIFFFKKIGSLSKVENETASWSKILDFFYLCFLLVQSF